MTFTAKTAALPLFLLLLLSLGCAVPGEPMPPLLDIPAAVSGLTAQQTGATIAVQIPVPQLTTEGTRPRRMERIDLLVAYLSPGSPPPDLSAEGTITRTWTAGEFAEWRKVIDHREILRSEHLGKRAWLAVRVRNHRGVDDGLSNTVAVDVVNLPAAPTDIAATVTERAIELRWKASSDLEFAGAAAAAAEFEIFRGPAGTDVPLESIGKSKASSYADTTFSFGQNYRYAVRAIVPSDVSLAVTGLSAPTQVAAFDRFAPAVPQNLRAIAVTGAVELAWSANSETDFAGYNVYREQDLGEGRASTRQKLNSALLDIPLFRDETAAAATAYRYVVTAVDREGNESEVSSEESVETE